MNILLIEDNVRLAENIADVLRQDGYTVDTAASGQEGVNSALTNLYNAIILDLNLPDIDGIEVCKRIREDSQTPPILMLTARINLESKIEGLDSGADDYLSKPFMMDELLARIRALLRRESTVKSTKTKIDNGIFIDLSSKQITRQGRVIRISPTEYRILEYLTLSRGQLKNQLEIYEAVWGNESSNLMMSDTLKVHINQIRKKLGDHIIENVRGQGYIIR